MTPDRHDDPWAAVPTQQERRDADRALQALTTALAQIEPNDTNYGIRYGLVLDAIAAAHRAGFPAGFGIDASPAADMDGFRVVAYIELPTGQVSWHMPEHDHAWDGHSTAEKHERINTWLADVLPF